jgi:2'-5' RNA ligase
VKVKKNSFQIWCLPLVVLAITGFAALARAEDAWKSQAPLALQVLAIDGSQEAFLVQKNYLAMVTPYPPTRELLQALEARLSELSGAPAKLLNRGESHVTVITPPEFAVLKKSLSIDAINLIAREEKLQSAKLEALCVGRGQASLDGRLEETYFVVVRSPDLLRLRRRIEKLFRQKGGTVEAFDAERYFPHITLGFTKDDLHESQGVIKSEKTCAFPFAR